MYLEGKGREEKIAQNYLVLHAENLNGDPPLVRAAIPSLGVGEPTISEVPHLPGTSWPPGEPPHWAIVCVMEKNHIVHPNGTTTLV